MLKLGANMLLNFNNVWCSYSNNALTTKMLLNYKNGCCSYLNIK